MFFTFILFYFQLKLLKEVEVEEEDDINAIGSSEMEKKKYQPFSEFEEDLKMFKFYCRAYGEKNKTSQIDGKVDVAIHQRGCE